MLYWLVLDDDQPMPDPPDPDPPPPDEERAGK